MSLGCKTDFKNCEVFYYIPQITWYYKFVIMEKLQLPFSSYQKEIPSSIFEGLAPAQKSNFLKLSDSKANLINYFCNLFELALFSGEPINPVFLENARNYYGTVNINSQLATGLRKAYENLFNDFKPEITDVVMKNIQDIFCYFEGQVNYSLVPEMTPHVFMALISLQNKILLGESIRQGVLNHMCKNDCLETTSRIDYQEMPHWLKSLVHAYCGEMKKHLTLYSDQVNAMMENKSHILEHIKLEISATISYMDLSIVSLLRIFDDPPTNLLELDSLKRTLMKIFLDVCFVGHHNNMLTKSIL